MTRACALALGLIAALAAGQYGVSTYTSEKSAAHATVINVAGRQRMLSQRTMMLATKLELADRTNPSTRNDVHTLLISARDLFVRSQQGLLAGNAEMGLPGGIDWQLRQVHGEPPHLLSERFRRYIALLDRVIAAEPGQIAQADLQEMYTLAQQPLLGALNAAVTVYEETANRDLALKRVVELAGLIACLFLLAVTALFIFRPMVRRVVTSTEALNTAREELEHSALHDSLTGLPNRRYLEEYLGRTLANARRNRHEVGLLHVDLDRFKQVNDTYGHAAGDAVLLAATKVMQAQIRKGDFLARIGGDEFIIVTPEVHNPRGLETLAERLVHHIAKPIPWEGHLCEIGASVGIAMSPPSTADTDCLIIDADVALYEAKDAGRNCYRIHEDTVAHIARVYPDDKVVSLETRLTA